MLLRAAAPRKCALRCAERPAALPLDRRGAATILLIDNYDSFTFNFVQALRALGAAVEVVRNDAASVPALLARRAAGVVLSPGPGRPADAGVTPALLAALPAAVPLLGVCLGHQALVESEGGRLERDPEPVHGRASPVHHAGGLLYRDLDDPFLAARYHSLRAERASLPASLEVEAWTADGVVMGVRHRALPRFGVQFHPESILSPDGDRLVARFLALCEPDPRRPASAGGARRDAT